MTGALLAAVVGACALLLASGLFRKGATYEFPFLAGAVFAGFLLPQFVGLTKTPYLPPGSLDMALAMAALVLAMCWLGHAAAAQPMRSFAWAFDERRLFWAAAALSGAGSYFYLAISRLPAEMTDATQWTGTPVMLLFFARMLTYGFAIAVLLAVRRPSLPNVMLALYGGAFYLHRILIAGRRAETVELALFVLLALWFVRRRAIPRSAMFAGLALGALAVNSVGEYRAIADDADGPRWEEVAKIDFIGNMTKLSDSGGYEAANAVHAIAETQESLAFDFGASHWNWLVFSYVPAQLVGSDFKESLTIPAPAGSDVRYRHRPHVGTTMTGLTDSFQSFWYFGALIFGLVAFILGKIYRAALRGSATAQLLFMLTITPALHMLTHHTMSFVAVWPHLALFLAPALWFARTGRPGAAPLDGRAYGVQENAT